MSKGALLCATLYIMVAHVIYAGALAQDQYDCHHIFTIICNEAFVESHQKEDAVYALLPITWLPVILWTGGFSYGFTFTAIPDPASYKDIAP